MSGFGIYTKVYENNDIKLIYKCSCGNTSSFYSEYKPRYKCEVCGNGYFENVYYMGGDSISNVWFKIIKEDVSGFIAERRIDNYTFYSNKELMLNYKNTTGIYRMIIDFRNNEFYFEDVKGNKLEFTNGRIQYFLKRVGNTNKFINSFKSYQLKELLWSLSLFSIYSENNSLPKGLSRFVNYYDKMKICQILSNCNFKREFLWKCGEEVNNLNFNKTKPNEILGISKCTLKSIREYDLEFKYLKHLRLLDNMGGGSIKLMLSKLAEECERYKMKLFLLHSEDYMLLIEKYKYDNKKLINYLCRDIKLQQGIDNPKEGLTILKDINKMCDDMEIKINEKYPKSLKKDHDIAMLNYKVKSDEIIDKKFTDIINKDTYKNLEFKNKDYSVIRPKKSSDLIKEGDSLSHCVSSYIKDVCNEKCKIYFIRYNDEKDRPLLTVEERNKRIVQVKGKFNRSANESEKDFIRLWADNKKIEFV